MIKNLLKRSGIDKDDIKYYNFIENELLTVDARAIDKFLKDLNALNDKDLRERLDEWSTYELVDLFDKVSQPNKSTKSPKTSKKINQNKRLETEVDVLIKSPVPTKDFKEFKSKYASVGKKIPYGIVRKVWITNFGDLYNKYGNPSNYNGKKDIDDNYIKNKLLPFIIYSANGHKLMKSSSDEESAYSTYYNLQIQNFKKQSKK